MRQIEKSNFNAIYGVVMTKAASLNFPLIKTFESERQRNRERMWNSARCTLDKPTKDKCTPRAYTTIDHLGNSLDVFMCVCAGVGMYSVLLVRTECIHERVSERAGEKK